MAHYYDDWNRKVSRNEIIDKIEHLKEVIKTYQTKKEQLERDMYYVKSPISYELLKSESE